MKGEKMKEKMKKVIIFFDIIILLLFLWGVIAVTLQLIYWGSALYYALDPNAQPVSWQLPTWAVFASFGIIFWRAKPVKRFLGVWETRIAAWLS